MAALLSQTLMIQECLPVEKATMPPNDDFLTLETTVAWLSQFSPEEQLPLAAMLRSMHLVSADDFMNRMRELVVQALGDGGRGPVGIYAEREVARNAAGITSLFKQSTLPPRRAHGVASPPVSPKLPWIADVGSEGIVARLITEIVRDYKGFAFNNPGPGLIRKYRIRRFVVVTDFVGSGKRVRDYLDSAWKVWSIRSWWSARAVRGMRFEVLAYSGTIEGCAYVQDHRASPEVRLLFPCPTIDSALSDELGEQVKAICVVRDPVEPDRVASLGYRGTGALIAFAHGAPNNVPRLLVDEGKKGRGRDYLPLFRRRSTASTRASFASSNASTAAALSSALIALGKSRFRGSLSERLTVGQLRMLLTLGALTRSPRTIVAISGRTGLTTVEVEEFLGKLKELAWIDSNFRITDRGQAQLKQARKYHRPVRSVPRLPDVYYYPSSLRAPVGDV